MTVPSSTPRGFELSVTRNDIPPVARPARGHTVGLSCGDRRPRLEERTPNSTGLEDARNETQKVRK